MNGSGRLSRLTATLMGLNARIAPETVAAITPKRGRMVHQSSATAAAPAIALGSMRLVDEKPKTRTLNAWIHSATGGLSTEMYPPGSNALKNQLCQFDAMLRAAAA